MIVFVFVAINNEAITATWIGGRKDEGDGRRSNGVAHLSRFTAKFGLTRFAVRMFPKLAQVPQEKKSDREIGARRKSGGV